MKKAPFFQYPSYLYYYVILQNKKKSFQNKLIFKNLNYKLTVFSFYLIRVLTQQLLFGNYFRRNQEHPKMASIHTVVML